jgi:hypothetical protein
MLLTLWYQASRISRYVGKESGARGREKVAVMVRGVGYVVFDPLEPPHDAF